MNDYEHVVLEAASPGEIKSGGKGWQITVGFAESPFGTCMIGESPRGICHLSFTDSRKNKVALALIQNDWPKAKLIHNNVRITKLAKQIFNPSGSESALLRTLVKGTKFQVVVWRALLKIKRGSLTSYGRLAKTIGKSKAYRAVGSAVGQNPIAFLIPCHRVIRQTGVIGEYHWGSARKQAIIGWEQAGNASPKTKKGEAKIT